MLWLVSCVSASKPSKWSRYRSFQLPTSLTLQIRLDAFPRWRDLNHFSETAKFREFADGRKYEDLSKVCSLMFLCRIPAELSVILL